MEQSITVQERKEYAAFLDALRDSGKTNMYGAVSYLKDEYPKLRENDALARQVLRDWMTCSGKEV